MSIVAIVIEAALALMMMMTMKVSVIEKRDELIVVVGGYSCGDECR